MSWLEWMTTFCCMVPLLGMAQQQGKELTFKEKVNFAISLLVYHQRGIVVPFRNKWGTQALGFPCLMALVLMVAWVFFSHDPFMLWYVGFWVCCLAWRRIEAVRLSGQIHSLSDGNTINLGPNENLAKLVLEPIGVGVLGCMVYWFYSINGWPTSGLPRFLLAGSVSLPMVESIKQTIWKRKTQALIDGKIENEGLVQDFNNKYGK